MQQRNSKEGSPENTTTTTSTTTTTNNNNNNNGESPAPNTPPEPTSSPVINRRHHRRRRERPRAVEVGVRPTTHSTACVISPIVVGLCLSQKTMEHAPQINRILRHSA